MNTERKGTGLRPHKLANRRALTVLIPFFWVVSLTVCIAQTYTTSGLTDNWDNPAAWIITNPENCANPNLALTPPLGPVFSPTCAIRIVINHPITRTAPNSNFGGGQMVSLTINNGGKLTFTGNMGINNVGGTAFQIEMNGGAQIEVVGTLALQTGADLTMINAAPVSPPTLLKAGALTFRNVGTGHSLNVGVNTIVEIAGQTRLEGGGTLNIQGSFYTGTLNSANAGGNQVNISGDGTLNTSGNMLIDGFPMTLTGNAGVVVGGNLTTSNSGNTALNLNGPNTNFIVLDFGSTLATAPIGNCFQQPEVPGDCSSQACLEVVQTENYNLNVPEAFDRIYIFRCSADWTVPNNTETEEIIDAAEILIVAGGGGGGRGNSAGGGGAGGLLYIDTEILTPGTSIPISIGKGGLGSVITSQRGGNGGNSAFGSSFVAIGGGGGGSIGGSVRAGTPGGSGGGAAFATGWEGGAGTTGQGTDGGDASQGVGLIRRGGGGGGILADGLTGNGTAGGDGGDGFESGISGSILAYAGGGGALGTDGFDVLGGAGGSAIGGDGNGPGTARNGNANTGSGGGATSTDEGGNGASGVVIIRQSFRILPVELLDVHAELKENEREVLVSWATGREWHNSHFEVERSDDGLKNWTSLGSVPGKGWSDEKTDYKFLDEAPILTGGHLYYRLKQVDFDGKFVYSKVVSVNVPRWIETNGNWLIYPNPVRSNPVRLVLLNTSAYYGESISLRVIHPMGQSVAMTGTNLEAFEQWMGKIFAHGLRGVFVVEITWGMQREYHKILTQD